MEATRQDMEQETADELIDRERHDLLPVAAVAAVVIIAEGVASFVEEIRRRFEIATRWV